jgi:hypothetical protein
MKERVEKGENLCVSLKSVAPKTLTLLGWPDRIRISSGWRSIGESHVMGSWPLMKSNGEKSVSRFCVIEAQ